MQKAILIGLAALFLAGCGNQTNALPPENSQPVDQANVVLPTPSTALVLKAFDFQFQPAEIRVKQGTPLVVQLDVVSGYHDLTIPDLQIKTEILAAGTSKTIIIPTDKKGSFEYYCSIGSHRAAGMRGMLIIE